MTVYGKLILYAIAAFTAVAIVLVIATCDDLQTKIPTVLQTAYAAVFVAPVVSAVAYICKTI